MKKNLSYEEFCKKADEVLAAKEKKDRNKFLYKGFRHDRLRKVMKEHGATVKDICDFIRLYASGLQIPTDCEECITEIVNGEDSPRIGELSAICQAVNVSSDYLLGLSDKVW